MAVRPENLDNPERDLNLSTRESDGKAGRKREDPAERRALRERLAMARTLTPQGRELHWRASWDQGRDAAVVAIEADGNTTGARALTAPDDVGCGDCFRRGRDAVVRLVEAP